MVKHKLRLLVRDILGDIFRSSGNDRVRPQRGRIVSIRAMKWVAEVLPCIDLPPTERCALWFLAYRHHDKTGECFPSIETIAAACGVSERRTRTAIQILKQWKLISVKRGATPSGNACNRYTLFGRPMRIPEHPPTHSDNMRPPVPGYPPTSDALP